MVPEVTPCYVTKIFKYGRMRCFPDVSDSAYPASSELFEKFPPQPHQGQSEDGFKFQIQHSPGKKRFITFSSLLISMDHLQTGQRGMRSRRFITTADLVKITQK